MIRKKKIIIGFTFLFTSFLVGCKGDKTEVGLDYWENDKNGQIRIKCFFRNDQLDGYCYRFYKNGQLMSKAVYEKDRLIKIVCVFDTLGRKLNFGKLDEKGTGHVFTYSDEYGTREHSGYYKNGRREGWWKNYTYRGEPTDSVFYKDSRPDFLQSLDIVMY